MARKYLFILILFLFTAFISKSQTISVTGTPTFSSSALNVIEAGNNFVSSLTSTSGSTINISNANFRYWHVNVDRVDINWNPNLIISVMRTSDGIGSGTISGGTAFQTVTTAETLFFNGYRNRTGITISYQISGISMIVPANNYSTTIYYTIYRN